MTRVTLGDDVERGRVVENVVVEREITAGVTSTTCFIDYGRFRDDIPRDDIHAPFLEGSPARLLDVGGDLGELVSGELAGPVRLYGLFDLAVGTWIERGR